MHRTALVICADCAKSERIILALESEHSIWHVARQRDAMAYLTRHHVDTVVVDLDMPSLDAETLLDTIRKQDAVVRTLVIGICESPASMPDSIAVRIDQLVNAVGYFDTDNRACR